MGKSFFKKYAPYFQALPLWLVMIVFMLVPIIVIVFYSTYRVENYVIATDFRLDDLGFLKQYWTTISNGSTWVAYWTGIKLTFFAWVISLVVGLMVSYYLVFDVVKLSTKIGLFLICVIPFWTSGVIRTLAWLPFFGIDGIVNRFLVWLGVVDAPLEFLLYSEFTVVVSYVHIYSLFMVAPIFNTMARINPSLIEAAIEYGASGWQTFRHVVLPLSMPGIVIGTIFVVTLAMGDFTSIKILGGGQTGNPAYLMVNFIPLQYPTAAAQGIILLVVLLLFVAGLTRIVDIRKQL